MTDEEKAADEKAQRNLQNLLAKQNGDATALAAQLLAENADLRGKNRELKATQKPDGATILTGDDAAKWKAYGEIGTPDEVTQRLKDAEGASGELETIKRTQAMREAVEKAGLDFADFSTRKGVDDWKYDATGEAPTVTVSENGKDVVKPLLDHAKALFPNIAAAVQSGTPVHNGAAIGAGGKGDEFAAIRKAAEEREKAVGGGASDRTQQLGLNQQ